MAGFHPSLETRDRAGGITGQSHELAGEWCNIQTPRAGRAYVTAVRSAAITTGYVALLRLYLARAGYTSGPLFRASINGRSGPLSYDAAHSRWTKYCAAAGVEIGIHQLRHAHATELINSGASIEVVRRRLGHASTETTQVYTLLADKVADTEVRAARRRRDQAAR